MADDPYRPPSYEPPDEGAGPPVVERVKSAVDAARAAGGAFLVAFAAWCVWSFAFLAVSPVAPWWPVLFLGGVPPAFLVAAIIGFDAFAGRYADWVAGLWRLLFLALFLGLAAMALIAMMPTP